MILDQSKVPSLFVCGKFSMSLNEIYIVTRIHISNSLEVKWKCRSSHLQSQGWCLDPWAVAEADAYLRGGRSRRRLAGLGSGRWAFRCVTVAVHGVEESFVE